MNKRYQYIITLDWTEANLIDKINRWLSKPDLTVEEKNDFDLTVDMLEDNINFILVDQIIPTMVKLHETSMVNWLPVDGTIPPKTNQRYLLSNGKHTSIGMFDDQGFCVTDIPVLALTVTYYAEVPVFNQ